MKHFFSAAVLALALATCAGPQISIAGGDDELVSQANRVPRELVNPALYADASAPAQVAPQVVVQPPDPSATSTAVIPAPSTFWTDFANGLTATIGTLLSAGVGWLIMRAGSWLHIDAKSTVLADVTHLVDNGIDLARVWAAKQLGPLAEDKLHDTLAGKTFELIEPLAAAALAQLGWTQDKLKTYIATRLAPETA